MRAATSRPALTLLQPLRPRCASVLFLHRFAQPELGVEGHDPGELTAHLEYLRRNKYHLMGLGELLGHIESGEPFKERAVVFTVDDGYADFAEVAAPIFAAYDCPVTVFLITDFTSEKLWNWFDKVPWILERAVRTDLAIDIGGRIVALNWTNLLGRAELAEDIVERLKRVPQEDQEAAIARLAERLEVDLPPGVPDRDRAMSWEDVRRCARRGVTFGPHTVTHPILSQVGPERSDWEIAESWRVVRAHTDSALPLFCYPNGTPADFSERERGSVERAGMRGSLSTVEASVASPPFSGRFDRFAIPRFAYPEDEPAFVQIASGLEALRGRRQG